MANQKERKVRENVFLEVETVEEIKQYCTKYKQVFGTNISMQHAIRTLVSAGMEVSARRLEAAEAIS